MKKNNYNKPNICVVELQHRTHLLTASDDTEPGSGQAREYRGDEGSSSSGGSVWDEEW